MLQFASDNIVGRSRLMTTAHSCKFGVVSSMTQTFDDLIDQLLQKKINPVRADILLLQQRAESSVENLPRHRRRRGTLHNLDSTTIW